MALWLDVVTLHFQWRIFKQLFRDEWTYPALDLAKGFFHQIHNVLGEHIVLACARLLDEDTRVASLPRLVGCVPKRKETTALKDALAHVTLLGGPFVRFRHRRIAHTELKAHRVFGGKVLPDISVDQVDKFLPAVDKVMREVCFAMGVGAPTGEPFPEDGSDGDTLVWNLFKALDWNDVAPGDARERSERLAKKGWRVRRR